MAYTKYSLTPADNNAAPPNGAPEGMLPSAVNDTMRDMMSQIRDVGDGIRGGTYTMTAPVITGGSVTGSTINNSAIGGTTAAAGKFTTLEATGVTTVQAGTVSAPAITTTGDTNTGIYFPAADTIAFTEGGVESMRITSAGNVGIGVSSPNDRLSVDAGVTVGSGVTSGYSVLSFVSSSTGSARHGSIRKNYDSPFDIRIRASNSTSDAPIIFESSSATERMRIASDGNVIIGATNPFAKFDVAQSSNATNSGRTGYIRSSWSGDVSTSALTVSKFDNNSTTSQIFVRFEINNTSTASGQINANGANTAAFGSTSDERVKEKIVNLPSQLDNIMSLRPVEFNYIETYGGGHQIGFIAQEMQAVYPDVVSSDDSAEKILSITGWSKTEARLVKAIQEQQNLIENLTTRLNALEGK